MCLFRLSEWNCGSTKIRRNPEFRQLLMGMSISRYLPAMGTAGLERCTVGGNRGEPRPPPRITLRTSFMRALSGLLRPFWHADGGACPPCLRAARRLWYAAQVTDDTALRPEGALPPAVVARPSALRRLGAGAWHVLARFRFLLLRPPLWSLALPPPILNIALLAPRR